MLLGVDGKSQVRKSICEDICLNEKSLMQELGFKPMTSQSFSGSSLVP